MKETLENISEYLTGKAAAKAPPSSVAMQQKMEKIALEVAFLQKELKEKQLEKEEKEKQFEAITKESQEIQNAIQSHNKEEVEIAKRRIAEAFHNPTIIKEKKFPDLQAQLENLQAMQSFLNKSSINSNEFKLLTKLFKALSKKNGKQYGYEEMCHDLDIEITNAEKINKKIFLAHFLGKSSEKVSLFSKEDYETGFQLLKDKVNVKIDLIPKTIEHLKKEKTEKSNSFKELKIKKNSLTEETSSITNSLKTIEKDIANIQERIKALQLEEIHANLSEAEISLQDFLDQDLSLKKNIANNKKDSKKTNDEIIKNIQATKQAREELPHKITVINKKLTALKAMGENEQTRNLDKKITSLTNQSKQLIDVDRILTYQLFSQIDQVGSKLKAMVDDFREIPTPHIEKSYNYNETTLEKLTEVINANQNNLLINKREVERLKTELGLLFEKLQELNYYLDNTEQRHFAEFDRKYAAIELTIKQAQALQNKLSSDRQKYMDDTELNKPLYARRHFNEKLAAIRTFVELTWNAKGRENLFRKEKNETLARIHENIPFEELPSIFKKLADETTSSPDEPRYAKDTLQQALREIELHMYLQKQAKEKSLEKRLLIITLIFPPAILVTLPYFIYHSMTQGKQGIQAMVIDNKASTSPEISTKNKTDLISKAGELRKQKFTEKELPQMNKSLFGKTLLLMSKDQKERVKAKMLLQADGKLSDEKRTTLEKNIADSKESSRANVEAHHYNSPSSKL